MARFRDSGQTFEIFSGELLVSNRGRPTVRGPSLPPVRSSVASYDVTVDLGPGALVLSANARITASAPGNAQIGSVASVRAANGEPAAPSKSLIVDFGALRTVAALSAPAGIVRVQPWQGAAFGEKIALDDTAATRVRTFSEVQVERLLLTLDSAVDPADLEGEGSALIPTPPTDLELLVDGARVQFWPGPARPVAAADEFTDDVPIGAQLQAAVDAGVAPVVVTLRAAVPGTLVLVVEHDALDTHLVAFPEGTTRVIDAPEEGEAALVVPLPEDAATWSVLEVRATVSGRTAPERALPPVGPALSQDAALALDADHAAVVGLPLDRLGLLEAVTALRLPLWVGVDGAELAGTVLEDLEGVPGEPLPGGRLGPLTLAPGSGVDGPPAWRTLAFATPWPVVPGRRVWVALQIAHGQVVWPLELPSGPLAPLRRRTPSGTFRVLSSAHIVDAETGERRPVDTSSGALRVVGTPPTNAPLSALDLRVAGREEVVSFTPTPDGVVVVLRLDEPASLATPTELPLLLTAAAAGPFSFSGVTVAYQPEAVQ